LPVCRNRRVLPEPVLQLCTKRGKRIFVPHRLLQASVLANRSVNSGSGIGRLWLSCSVGSSACWTEHATRYLLSAGLQGKNVDRSVPADRGGKGLLATKGVWLHPPCRNRASALWGAIPQAFDHATNSVRSTRRLPVSQLYTQLWGFLSRFPAPAASGRLPLARFAEMAAVARRPWSAGISWP
jgi:hypothetical protein